MAIGLMLQHCPDCSQILCELNRWLLLLSCPIEERTDFVYPASLKVYEGAS
jgi:hypothetical protein